MIHDDSTTAVECADQSRGRFPMARGARQGCLASGFFFTISFVPIFRWLHDGDHPKGDFSTFTAHTMRFCR